MLSYFSNKTAAGSQDESLELEFLFSPNSLDALSGGPWPWPQHGKHKPKLKPKHGPYHNPNGPGTPRAFWRKVKDELRQFFLNQRREGAYTAPGNGSPNNIEHKPTPTGAGKPPVLHGGGVAQLPPRRPRLDVPPLPPFNLPGSLPVPMEPVPIATHLQPVEFQFRGEELTLTPDKPISYKQQVLFIENTANFINRAQALAVMRELLGIMLEHNDVHVTIIGNAANDSRLSGAFFMPYGSDKALLMRAPMGGWYEGKPQWYSPKHETLGGLMLARARAIGKLLTDQGVPRSRVHCHIGTFGYGTRDKPNSGALKRRATIVISQKP